MSNSVFPYSIDTFIDPAANTPQNSAMPHHLQHAKANDAIVSMEHLLSQQPIPFHSTITPNAIEGNLVLVGTLTGNVTINPPLNPVSLSSPLVFIFTQDGIGNHNVLWSPSYATSWNPTSTAGSISSIGFIYQASSYTWLPVFAYPAQETITSLGELSIFGNLSVTGQTFLDSTVYSNGIVDNSGAGISTVGNLSSTGSLTVGNGASVTGNTVVNGSFSTTTSAGRITASNGLVVSSGGMNVTGGATIANGLTVSSGALSLPAGNATFSDNLSVYGVSSLAVTNVSGLLTASSGLNVTGAVTSTSLSTGGITATNVNTTGAVTGASVAVTGAVTGGTIVATSSPAGRLYQGNNAQTFGSSGYSYAKLGSEDYLYGGVTTGNVGVGANSQLNLPVTGVYTVKGQLQFGAASTTMNVAIVLYKNGSFIRQGDEFNGLTVADGAGLSLSVCDDILCNAGDSLQLVVYLSTPSISLLTNTYGIVNYMSASLVTQ